MSELLDKLQQASDWTGIVDTARDLSVRDDPSDVPALIAALKDPLEARRWGAVYALGSSRLDRRVVAPLVEVLLDKRETPRVRAQAAECLGATGSRKALRALIECSTDESAEVRFWCVFALGQCGRRCRRRRHKPPMRIVRALEARLEDHACPDTRGYWPIRLEALAVLYGTGMRHPARDTFREEMLAVLQDPLQHPVKWPWAAWYWDIFDLASQSEARSLFDAAIQTIHKAGFDPVQFGRESLKRL